MAFIKQKIDPSVPHPEYVEMARRVELTEDAFEGEVTKYVEPLSNQNKREWNAYVARAAYFNMVERSATALTGALTRKPFQLTGYDEFPENEYGDGQTFIQAMYRDLLLGGRLFMLVDVDEDGQSNIITYDADDIINWRGEMDDANSFVMIKQCELILDPANPYNQITQESYRELYTDETGLYGVRVWVQDGKGKWNATELEPLLINGKRLNYIPLFVTTPFDTTWAIYNPPLYTQACLNIQHFKQATDLAHYAHFMALPTFTITGDLFTYVDDVGSMTKAEIRLGSTTEALHLATGGTASYTEVSGASFSMLQNELKNIEERIYIAGSRLLSSKKGIESAEALQLRSGSESAVLVSMVHSLENTLTNVLELCALIDNVPTPTIDLNDDFSSAMMDSLQIQALLALYTAGTITIEQLLNSLYLGEVVAEPEDLEVNEKPAHPEDTEPLTDEDEDVYTDTGNLVDDITKRPGNSSPGDYNRYGVAIR